MSESRKPVIGLIGGIGSGKSRVAAELARHGGRIVAGDEAGHEALRQPAIQEQLVRRWGPEVLDPQGAISRRHVGAIVFADPAQRRALEELVFTWIKQRLREQIEDYERLLCEAAMSDDSGPHHNLIKTIEKQKANLEVRLTELAAEHKKDDGLVFDELGVDHIFMDEAHYFKNLETQTKMQRVAGIGDTVRRILDDAEARGVTPLLAAEELAASRLRAGAAVAAR